VPKYTCERCCRPLKPSETITCDDCHAENLRQLLASPAWMKVRGPYMADALRAELRGLKGNP